jgi:hypothetical protein
MVKAATVTLKNRFSRDMGRRLGKTLVERLGDFPHYTTPGAFPARSSRFYKTPYHPP